MNHPAADLRCYENGGSDDINLHHGWPTSPRHQVLFPPEPTQLKAKNSNRMLQHDTEGLDIAPEATEFIDQIRRISILKCKLVWRIEMLVLAGMDKCPCAPRNVCSDCENRTCVWKGKMTRKEKGFDSTDLQSLLAAAWLKGELSGDGSVPWLQWNDEMGP